MASRILPALIKYIVSEVQDDGYEILRTRLVKLLYLCDVSYYQSRKETLTGLNWIRYKYGPFAFELSDITRKMGLDLREEELDFSTSRGVKYEVYDVPDPQSWLEIGQKNVIDKVIERWGGEDLNTLLDFVYCDTEPMIGAEFQQPLDFHKIKSGLRYATGDKLDLPAESIAMIKGIAEKQSSLSKPPTEAKFTKRTREIADDETPTPNLTGKVKTDNYYVNFFGIRE